MLILRIQETKLTEQKKKKKTPMFTVFFSSFLNKFCFVLFFSFSSLFTFLLLFCFRLFFSFFFFFFLLFVLSYIILKNVFCENTSVFATNKTNYTPLSMKSYVAVSCDSKLERIDDSAWISKTFNSIDKLFTRQQTNSFQVINCNFLIPLCTKKLIYKLASR